MAGPARPFRFATSILEILHFYRGRPVGEPGTDAPPPA
jgi:hypothetical protein